MTIHVLWCCRCIISLAFRLLEESVLSVKRIGAQSKRNKDRDTKNNVQPISGFFQVGFDFWNKKFLLIFFFYSMTVCNFALSSFFFFLWLGFLKHCNEKSFDLNVCSQLWQWQFSVSKLFFFRSLFYGTFEPWG